MSQLPPWTRKPWVKPALLGGVALLVVIVAATLSGGDDEPPAVVDASNVAQKASADEREDAAEDAEADEKSKPEDEIAIDDAKGEGGESDEAKADRALRANLASIDALIESKQFASARITLGPLLEVYDDEPRLHWRMGKVQYALNKKTNGAAALQSYRNALALDSSLLDDPAFAGELWPLIDLPKNRVLAVDIGVELMGDAAHERLVKWLNVQAAPLPYATRHKAIDHLTAAGKASAINVPLQVALDLWQASTAEQPCEVFSGALAAAEKEPDSFLWGSIVDAPIPTAGEGECPGVAGSRDSLATEYAQRYAGLVRIVPAAYAKRRRTK